MNDDNECSYLVYDKRSNEIIGQVSLIEPMDQDDLSKFLEIAAYEIEKSDKIMREFLHFEKVPDRNMLS